MINRVYDIDSDPGAVMKALFQWWGDAFAHAMGAVDLDEKRQVPPPIGIQPYRDIPCKHHHNGWVITTQSRDWSNQPTKASWMCWLISSAHPPAHAQNWAVIHALNNRGWTVAAHKLLKMFSIDVWRQHIKSKLWWQKESHVGLWIHSNFSHGCFCHCTSSDCFESLPAQAAKQCV